MISREVVVGFTVNMIVLLVVMFVVLDLAEARRFLNAIEGERAFAGQ
jgi:hypothetical protein